MASKIEIQHLLQDTDFTCFVIPSLFTKEDCEQFLSTDIKNSFQKASSNYPTYYRNNDRFVLDDEVLANRLFEKVKPYLPERIEINSPIQSENGIWQLQELNSRLRFCKYSANQYFHRHLDGVHYRNDTTQSKLTFMIYLNSATEFEGGRTLFFRTKETEEIWASYIPKQGDLIVFDHNVWHEGEVLRKGEKFVLRSDILYSKNDAVTASEPFTGHLGYIWKLLKMNDTTILSGGRDKEIKVWTAQGEQRKSLQGHQNSILCMEKISEDVFISGSRDQQIIVWKDYNILNILKTHAAVVLSLCRIDDSMFASGSGDNTIKLSNLDGTTVKTYREHSNWVWQVLKLDDQVIASCSEDGSIKIWNLGSEKSINTFESGTSVISLAYNSENRKLISGGLNGEVSIRRLTSDYQQAEIKIFKAHNGIIRTIKMIDNNRFATGGEDNKVKIWNLNGQLISELEHQNFVQSLELVDDKTLISASYDGTIKIGDIDSMNRIK
ncbi:MAG: 2OG-Fe(II) oxygenase [Fluviicola sp.]